MKTDLYSMYLLFCIKSSDEPKVHYFIRSRKVLHVNKMSHVKFMFFESQQNEDILNHENRQE